MVPCAGAVSPVKDQGICGSCWSFGAAEAMEGQLFLETGNLVQLSQQAFMDCSWAMGNNACDGGEVCTPTPAALNQVVSPAC